MSSLMMTMMRTYPAIPLARATRIIITTTKPSPRFSPARGFASKPTAPPSSSSPSSPTTTTNLLREPADGKTAIVTGSARGIGRAIALRLAADGYDVCVNDVAAHAAACKEVVGEIRALGRRATAAVADVSRRAEVRGLVAHSVRELGPLYTMVANAGIAQVKGLLDLTEADFDRMVAVNLTGVHNCYAEAALQMLSQEQEQEQKPEGTTDAPASAPRGKLIGAASIVAFRPLALLGHYSATKWAVRGLTQAYAMELAGRGITANAYAPGIVGTAMWDRIDEGLAAVQAVTDEGQGGSVKGEEKKKNKGDMMRKYVQERTLLQRASVPEDVAKLVSYLASSDSDFVTGQTQIVDGGIVFT